jgi:hypothetical protein
VLDLRGLAVFLGRPAVLLTGCSLLQKNTDAEEYANLLAQRKAEIRERRSESLAKKRAARMASQASQN